MAGAFEFEITPNLNISQLQAKIAEVRAELQTLNAQKAQFAEAAVNPVSAGLGGAQASASASAAALDAPIAKLETTFAGLVAQATEYEAALGRAAYAEEQATEALIARRQSILNQIAVNNQLLAAEEGSVAAETLNLEAKASVQGQLIGAQARLAQIATIEAAGREEFNAQLAAAAVAELRAKAELALVTQVAVNEQIQADAATGVATVPQLQAAAAYEQQFATLSQKNELLKLQLAGDERITALQAESVVLQEQWNLLSKERNDATLLQARQSGALPAEDGGGLLGFGGVGGIAKFALGAAAFVGISAGIVGVLKEATALQTQFSILQTQLEQTDRAGDFPILKSGLLDIARQTGINTSDLAKLAIQISGAFQGSSGDRGTPNFVLEQVKSAAELQKVFGISSQDIQQSVIALAYTFDTNFQAIGDKAAGLQSRFGVSAKELITSISQIAPVAQQMGLSFNQLAAVSAAAERETGRTGVSVTEALGRVLPNIQQHTLDVLAVYQGNTALAGSYEKILSDISSGKTGDVLLQLIQDWSKLGQVQKDTLLSTLGGGRQAPQLAAVFGDPQLLKELNNPTNDTGKLADQFKHLQTTFSQAAAEVKQQFIQLGVSLSGVVLPVLQDLIHAFGLIISVLAPVASFLGTLTNAFDGLGGNILTVVVALKALSLAQNLLVGEAGLRAVLSGSAAAGEGGLLGKTLAAGGTTAGEGGLFAGGGALVGGATFGPLILGAGVAALALNSLADSANKAVDSEKSKVAHNIATDPSRAVKRAESDKGPPVGGPISNAVDTAGVLIHNVAIPIFGGSSEKTPDQRVTDEYQKQFGQLWIEQFKAVGKSLNIDPKKLAGLAPTAKQGSSLGLFKDVNQNEVNLNTIDPRDDQVFAELEKAHKELVKKLGTKTIENAVKAYKGSKTEKNFNNALLGAVADTGNASNLDSATNDLLDQTKANYQAGQISGQGYVSQLEEYRKTILDVISRGAVTTKVVQAYDKANAQISDYYKTSITNGLTALRNIKNVQGFDVGGDDVTAAVQALQNPNFTDITAREQVVSQAFADLKTILQKREDGVKTAAEKLAIDQQGIEVPEALKLAALEPILEQALNDSNLNVQKLEAAVTAAGGLSNVQFEDRVIAVAQYLGVNIYQATLIVLEGLLKDAKDRVNALVIAQLKALDFRQKTLKVIAEAEGKVKDIQGQIDALKKAAGDLSLSQTLSSIGNLSTGNAPSLADQANNDAATEAKAIAKAQGEIAKAQAHGDPVAIALAGIADANNDYATATKESERLTAIAAQINAQNAYQDALNGIVTAQGNLLASWVANDPVASATVAIAQANHAADIAVGEAAKLDAAAQQVKAQQALQLAIHNVFDSTINLAKAMAQFAGDSVAAAQDGLKLAQSALYYAVFSHSGDAAINDARGQVITAQAALRDAQIKEREDTIDFNLQTQNISTAQAIAQYQALLSSADILQLTTQERRDLILKIQQLKGDLQKDLQFDLPTDLALPTLYEARRLNQSGGNYQDNRTVTISLSSTDPASTEAAVTQITDAINSPAVYGSGTRIY